MVGFHCGHAHHDHMDSIFRRTDGPDGISVQHPAYCAGIRGLPFPKSTTSQHVLHLLYLQHLAASATLGQGHEIGSVCSSSATLYIRRAVCWMHNRGHIQLDHDGHDCSESGPDPLRHPRHQCLVRPKCPAVQQPRCFIFHGTPALQRRQEVRMGYNCLAPGLSGTCALLAGPSRHGMAHFQLYEHYDHIVVHG